MNKIFEIRQAKKYIQYLLAQNLSEEYIISKLYQSYGASIGLPKLTTLLEQYTKFVPITSFNIGDMVQFTDLSIMFIIGFENGQYLLERVDGDGIYYCHPLYDAKLIKSA